MRSRITVGRRTLSYLEAVGAQAPAPAPAKPQVTVLLHGFPLNAEMWMPQLSSVPDGWRFIAPDLPGYGETDPLLPRAGTPTGIDEYAADVIDLMDALHIDSAVIGGISMGGYVAFAIHRRAPTYFLGMVLANTKAPGDSPEGRAGRARMIELVSAEGASGVARQMLPKLVGADTARERPDVVKRIDALILAARPEAIVSALHAMMGRPDSTGDLVRIACPTLVVTGEQDALIPTEESYALQRKILSAQIEVLPGAGHLSNMEQPEAFNRTLIRFLRNNV